MACNIYVKNTDNVSDLFNTLKEVYNDGNKYPETWDMNSAVSQGLKSSVEYAKIFSKEFKDFFGDWENSTNESGILNSQGEPKLHRLGSFSFYINKEGKRLLIETDEYGGLSSQQQYEIINSLTGRFFDEIDFSVLTTRQVSKEAIEKFVNAEKEYLNSLAEQAKTTFFNNTTSEEALQNYSKRLLASSVLNNYSHIIVRDITAALEEKKLNVVEDESNAMEEEVDSTDPLNITSSQNKNSKTTASSFIKLMLSSKVPQIEYVAGEVKIKTSEMLGEEYVVYEEFDKVWNMLESALANRPITLDENGNVKNIIDEYLNEIERLADIHPGFSELHEYISGITDVETLDKLFAAFNKTKENYITSVATVPFSEKQSISFKQYNTQQNSPGKKLSEQWSTNFIRSEATDTTTVNYKVNAEIVNVVSNNLKKINERLLSIQENKVDVEATLNYTKQQLAKIGIIVDNNALNYYLKYYAGEGTFKDKFHNLVMSLTSNLNVKNKAFPKALIQDNKSVNVFKNLEHIQQLATVQALFNGRMEESTVVADKMFWIYSLPGFVDIVLNEAKNGDVSYFQNLKSVPYFAVSETLDDIIKNPNQYSLNQFFGIKTNREGSELIDNKNVDVQAHLASDIDKMYFALSKVKDNTTDAKELTEDREGVRVEVSMPVNADKSKYKYLKGYKFHQVYYDTQTNEFDSVTVQKFISRFYQELRRVKLAFNGEYDMLPGKFKESAKSFQLFSDLTYDKITDDVLKYMLYKVDAQGKVVGIKNETLDEEVLAGYINDFLNNLLNLEVQKLKDNGILNEDGTYDLVPSYIKETPQFKNNSRAFAAEFLVNGVLSTFDLTGIFHGDPGMYKSLEDLIKRYPAAHSDGIYPRIANESEKYFNVAVVNNVVTSDKQNKNITIPDDKVKEIVKYYKDNYNLSEEEVKGILNPVRNSGINLTDAQGWATLDRWKFIAQKTQVWTSVHDSAYKKMKAWNTNRQELTPQELKIATQPLKTTYFGFDEKGIPVFLKYSLSVMNPMLVDGTQLEALKNAMESQGVDEMVTLDGVKVGAQNPADIYNAETNEIISDVKFSKIKLDNRYIKLQQQLPTKNFKSDAIKTQFLKNILEGIDLTNAVYTLDGQEVNGQEVLNNINEAIEDIIERQYNSLKSQFTDENGFNRQKLDEALLTQLQGGLNNIIKAVIKGLPYNVMPEAKAKIQQVFYSKLKKAALNIKMDSASLIQVSNFGIETVTDVERSGIYLLKDVNKLQMPQFETYTDNEGNTKHSVKAAQIFVPHHVVAKHIPNYKDLSLEEFKELVPDEMMRMIGYRVPNQGMSSNAAIEIAGILPPNAGDQAIIYSGITTITGSDFDIDKMFVFMPSFRANYEGFMQVFNNSISKEDVKQFNTLKGSIEEVFGESFKNIQELAAYLKDINEDTLNSNLEENVLLILKNYLSDLYRKIDNLPQGQFTGFSKRDNSQNKLFDNYWAILTSPANYLNSIRSIDANELQTNVKKHNEEQMEELIPGEFFTKMFQLEKKVALQKAKGGVGQTANQMVDHPFGVIGNMAFNDEGILAEISHRKEVAEGATYAAIDNVFIKGTNKHIAWSISEYLNAFVDVAKDDYITKGNYESATNNVAFSMLRAGVDPEIVVAFIGSDPVRQYIRSITKYESPLRISKSNKEVLNITESALGIEGIEATPTNVFVGNKNNILKKLNNPNIQDTANILHAFLRLQSASKHVNIQMNATRLDSLPSKTSIDQIIAENLISMSLKNMELIGFDTKIMRSHLKTFFKYGIMESQELTSKMFWEVTPQGKELLNKMSMGLNGNILKDADLGNDLSSYITSIVNNISGFTDNVNLKDLVNRETGLYARIKKHLENNSNYLLENIIEMPISADGVYSFLKLPNLNFSTLQSNLVIQGWEELLQTDKQLAIDLFKFTYLTSGLKSNQSNLVRFIPTELRGVITEGENTFDIAQELMDNLEETLSDSKSIETIMDIIAKNFYTNAKIVRPLSKKVLPKDFEKYVASTGFLPPLRASQTNLSFENLGGKIGFKPYVMTYKTVKNEFTGATNKIYRVYKLVGNTPILNKKGAITDYDLHYVQLENSAHKFGEQTTYEFNGKINPFLSPNLFVDKKIKKAHYEKLMSDPTFAPHTFIDNSINDVYTDNLLSAAEDLLTLVEAGEINSPIKKLNEESLFSSPEESITTVTSEGPVFSYKGKTINTEFKLSSDQENALKSLIDFYNGDSPRIVLQGAAGTGKTSIIGYLQKYLETNFLYTAPTHAATVELGVATVKTGNTRMPITVASSMKFNKKTGLHELSFKANQKLGFGRLIVVDEVSMLNSSDYTKLLDLEKKGYKIIFIGDKKQIPEVQSVSFDTKNISNAFTSNPVINLDTIHRTSNKNIKNILQKIRDSITFQLFKIKENTENVKFFSSDLDFKQKLSETVKKDPQNTDYIGYTNASVQSMNKLIREEVFGRKGEIQEGDILIGYLGYASKQIEKGDIANSVSYKVEKVSVVDKSNYKAYSILASSERISNLINMGISDIPNISSTEFLPLSKSDVFETNFTKEDFDKNNKYLSDMFSKLNTLILNYKQSGNNGDYVNYISYKEGISDTLAKLELGGDYIFNPFTNKVEQYNKNNKSTEHQKIFNTYKNFANDFVVEKGLDFGHAITIHKSQGRTTKNVFFDANTITNRDTNILENGKQISTERQSLGYVGMSRASKNLFVNQGWVSFNEIENVAEEETTTDAITKQAEDKSNLNVKTYSGKVNLLNENQVFVFGSNPEGRHGKGAASTAMRFGAKKGEIKSDKTFGLITKDLMGYANFDKSMLQVTPSGKVYYESEEATFWKDKIDYKGKTYKKLDDGTATTGNLQEGLIRKRTQFTRPSEGGKWLHKLPADFIKVKIQELYEEAVANPNKEYLIAYGNEPKRSLNGYTSQELADMFSAFPIPNNIVFNEDFAKLLNNQNQSNLFEQITPIKEGVPELFESNPELANAVYEALGFKTNILPEYKVEDFGEEDKRFANISKFHGVRLNSRQEINVSNFFDYITNISEQKKLVMEIMEKEYDITLKDLKDLIVTDEDAKLFILLHEQAHIDNLDLENEKYKGLEKTHLLILKAEARANQNAYVNLKKYKEFSPTSQQKQQAQQLYSQYVEQTGKQDIQGFKEFVGSKEKITPKKPESMDENVWNALSLQEQIKITEC